MGAMIAAGPVHVEDLGWWPVAGDGAGTIRRAAVGLGQELGLSEGRIADLAIIATEVDSNLGKHAVDGVVHLRALRRDGEVAVELVAIDAGPGMADLNVSARDGHSTTGTLGIGLGAIARLATELDVFSLPDRGTVLTAAVWQHRSAPNPPAAGAVARSAGLIRPMAGESVSGDGYAIRERQGRLQAVLCDGLGHGPLAAAASQAVAAAFRDAPMTGVAGVLEHLHRSVTHTRGAVAAVIEFDPAAGTVRCASMGNVAAWIVGPDRRRAMTAQPGFVGDRQRRTIREYDYPLAGGDLVVLHSDGLTDRWDLSGYPGLLRHTPLVIAATLLRDAGVRRDDAGVLVVKAADPP
jgi:anti-sigma regulatory factor (Ser/Thr protein kinase)